MISIPAIRDRVIQGALRLIMEPIFDADFSDSSFGARLGRSAYEAIEKVRTGLRRRRHRVVDVDGPAACLALAFGHREIATLLTEYGDNASDDRCPDWDRAAWQRWIEKAYSP